MRIEKNTFYFKMVLLFFPALLFVSGCAGSAYNSSIGAVAFQIQLADTLLSHLSFDDHASHSYLIHQRNLQVLRSVGEFCLTVSAPLYKSDSVFLKTPKNAWQAPLTIYLEWLSASNKASIALSRDLEQMRHHPVEFRLLLSIHDEMIFNRKIVETKLRPLLLSRFDLATLEFLIGIEYDDLERAYKKIADLEFDRMQIIRNNLVQ